MKTGLSGRNVNFSRAIEASEFGSISRLAKHIGVHYNCLYTYLCLERSPIDRQGCVKYDAAAICEALGCELTDLFPKAALDRPYRFRKSYADGYGQRAPKVPVQKHFPERCLTQDQAEALVSLLDVRALIPPEAALSVAEELVRRLSQDDFDVFSRMAFEAMAVADIEAALGIGSKAVRSRYTNALRQLNSPTTLKVVRAVKTDL